MSSFKDRRKEALEACSKVINGIEDDTITVSAALLLCKKIARLVNDEEGMRWLSYEYGGYPHGEKGYIEPAAWQIASEHGRQYKGKDNKGNYVDYVFLEQCGELETAIESMKKTLGNYTTQGFSVSGDYAVIATNNLTKHITSHTNNLLEKIRLNEKRLSILKSQYYDYAVKWYINLSFENEAKKVFEEYQDRVNIFFSDLPITIVQKLNAIEDMLEDGNPERYSQVVTSCRRLWTEVSDYLFRRVLPGYERETFSTKSGKEIRIKGDYSINKISAVIETLQSKAAKNTLVGSETIYLIDWIEQISNSQSTGVHHDITREEAMQCIIHTYIALGDILRLKDEVLGNESATTTPRL